MRNPIDRLNDFNEIWNENIDVKGICDKCHNCDDALCANKLKFDNQFVGCPLNINIPKILDLMKYNLYEDAYKLLISNNPFPEITERICKGYCEYSCIETKNNNPIEIRDVLKYLADYGLKRNLYNPSITKNGKTVSIIGGGVSGLSAAYYLASKGFNVKVYEKEQTPGGILYNGIPNMILDKSILNNRIDILKAMGVEFICDCEVTRIIDPKTIQNSSDAILVASGKSVPKALDVKSTWYKEVLYAKDYIKKSNNAVMEKGYSDLLKGKKVLIVGSGETSSNVLSIALREKASMVAVIDYMPMPSINRSNSWPFIPDGLRMDYAYSEARAKTKMEPRSFNSTVTCFLGDTSLKKIKLVDVKWIDGKPVYQDKEKEFFIDSVIIAIGYESADKDLLRYLGINIDNNYHSHDNVFIAGTALHDLDGVCQTILDGLNAAKEIEVYLNEA